ncbi:MAG: ABC transporter six-transmembrane domain-containing protein [Pseudomonadota bacterium]
MTEKSQDLETPAGDKTPTVEQGAKLFDAVRPFKLRIAFTYGLALIENVFELLYPFTIGLAINGLIAGEGWVSLAPFAGIWIFHIATGTARQLYDTRLFAKVYSEVTGGMVVRQRKAGVSTGEVTARAVMAREAVDFFEFEVQAVATALINLIGGVFMLFIYDVQAGAVMALLLIPIFILYFLYGRKSLALSIRLNNRHEREVDAIEDGRRQRVRRHYKAWARWRIWLSDAQARTWAAADLLMFGAVMFVILKITSEPGVQAGDVFAAISYVLTIIMALDEAPFLVEQASRLVDIGRRIDKTDA